jgi:uncharacterized membrane protein (DUF485 family)
MPHGDAHAWPHPEHPDTTADTAADSRTGTTTDRTPTDATTGGTAGRPGFQVLYETGGLADESPEPWQDGVRPGRHPHSGHHGDLRRLRRTYRIQRRTTTFLALGWFTAFLILSTRCPALMARPLVDGLPTGLVLALSHIPVTWLAVVLYERTARRYVDPLAFRVTRHTPWAADPEQEKGR